MNIADAISQYADYLKNMSDTPRLDVEIFLSETLNLSKAQLVAYSDQEITETQLDQLEGWVRRRHAGEPVAYIVGHQPFWTLDLKVTPAILIPRPETEQLVEWVLQETNEHQCLSVLDLGVGSGAIALALAKERPIWALDAVDKSDDALLVAKENAERNNIHNVDFYLGSWFQPLSQDKRYDVIVSNPPYICETDSHLKKLKYEPYTALVSEQQGLGDLKHIISGAQQHLSPGGYLVVEHGYEQGDAVMKLMRDAGFVEVDLHFDLAQQPRFVTARHKE